MNIKPGIVVLLTGIALFATSSGVTDRSWLSEVRSDGTTAGESTLWNPPGSLVRPRGSANVRAFGAIGNGVHDDTAAIQAAIDSLSRSGGVVLFPVGQYLVSGQIVLPNDGGDPPRQPPLIFRGAGALFDGRGGAPSGGTILDLRHAGGAKIVTFGLGLLEMHGITLADFGDDDSTFLYTTNTTLLIHDCAFYGTRAGKNARNDALLLGGTDAQAVGTAEENAPFQGYGTVIRDNYFGQMRRMVYGRVFANGVVVTGNTVWKNSGSNLPGGAAIELHGDPDDTTVEINGGWYVAGNLIEVPFYDYGIKCQQSQRNVFHGNNFYDPSATLAYYRFEPSGKLNYVVAGYHSDAWTFVDDQATGIDRSTIVNFHQSRESRYAQPVRFLNELILEPQAGSTAPFGPRLRSSGGAELTYQLTNDSSMFVSYVPEGGAPVPLWQVRDYGEGKIIQELKGADAGIRNMNGAVTLQTKVGSALELGDASGLGITIDAGEIGFTSTSTRILSGNGVPDADAPDGSLYLRSDGGPGSTLYVRESGTWVAK